MGMGYDDSDLAPMNLLGMSLDEYLMLNGWIDIHDDNHTVSSSGDASRHLFRTPDDSEHRYFARIVVNFNTKSEYEVTKNPTLASGSVGSGTRAILSNIIDGFALRTSIEVREDLLASGAYDAGSGMNWHSRLGASGATPASSAVGGDLKDGWRGLANNTTYVFTATALADDLESDTRFEFMKLKLQA